LRQLLRRGCGPADVERRPGIAQSGLDEQEALAGADRQRRTANVEIGRRPQVIRWSEPAANRLEPCPIGGKSCLAQDPLGAPLLVPALELEPVEPRIARRLDPLLGKAPLQLLEVVDARPRRPLDPCPQPVEIGAQRLDPDPAQVAGVARLRRHRDERRDRHRPDRRGRAPPRSPALPHHSPQLARAHLKSSFGHRVSLRASAGACGSMAARWRSFTWFLPGNAG